MKTDAAFFGLAAIALLSGCGLQRQPAPAKTFYMLDVRPQTAVLGAGGVHCLRLRPVNVQTPFAGTALIYRTGEMTWEKDYYNHFLVTPDQQLGKLLEDLMRNAGITECVDQADNDGPRLTLEPHIEALYADFRTAAAPEAYAKIRFVVTRYDRSCRCSSIQLDQAFEAAIPLPPKPSAEAVVQAMSKAIEDILNRFSRQL